METAKDSEQQPLPVATKVDEAVMGDAQTSLASAAECIAEGLVMTALLEQKTTPEQKAGKVKIYLDRVTVQESVLKRPVKMHEAVLKQASALVLNGS